MITVTGRLGYGNRKQVWHWLKRLGAKINGHVTSTTNLLIVGAHYLGDDRHKIHEAEKRSVEMLTEARFRKKFVDQ